MIREMAQESKIKNTNIKVYIMGKEYEVPAGLTITKAFEYAGYKLIRGVGCRAGFCGACTTIYRKANDYKLYTGLACQTLVENGLHLVQLPFVPAEKSSHKLENFKLSQPLDSSLRTNIILKVYPEIARCVCCNTCTKSCPQELQVMDFIQASLRGDIEKVVNISFDCIQCGICALRCPADIKQYHIAQLARRIYGKYLSKRSKSREQRLKEIAEDKFKTEFDRMMHLGLEELRELYKKREIESE